MGGDFGPRSIVQACIASLSATPSLHLTLVGQPSLLEELIASHPAVDRARLTITPASETISMDEKPAVALRGKPDSSMRVALELLRDGKVQACVSAGNTGALMALSRIFGGPMVEHDFRYSLMNPQHTLTECRALTPGRYQVTGNGCEASV